MMPSGDPRSRTNELVCSSTRENGEPIEYRLYVSEYGGFQYTSSARGSGYVQQNGTWERVELSGDQAADLRQGLEELLVDGQPAVRLEYR